MELLEFARGPALQFAITVFVAGLVFRVVSLALMWRTRDSSEGSSRSTSPAYWPYRPDSTVPAVPRSPTFFNPATFTASQTSSIMLSRGTDSRETIASYQI